VLEGIANI